MADDNLGEDFIGDAIKEATLTEQQKKIVEDYLFSNSEITHYSL